ncbi:MAG: hypothetical protein LBG65_02685 [Puniceicoccales bacterium]|nr:hypothetical protein [Puniceicoccales bacterium]
MLEACDLRDNKKDYIAARKKLQEALAVIPNDPVIQSELDSTNKVFASRPLIEQVVAERNELLKEIEVAIIEADLLGQHKQYAEALSLLDDALAVLPDNASTAGIRNKLVVKRNEVIAWRDGRIAPRLDAEQAIALTVKELRDNTRLAVQLAEEAERKIRRHQLEAAEEDLVKAVKILPNNAAVEKQRKYITSVRAKLAYVFWLDAVNARNLDVAERYFVSYGQIVGKDSKEFLRFKESFDDIKKNPRYINIAVVDADIPEASKKAQKLLLEAKALYLHGNYEAAHDRYRDVLLYEPHNTEAKYFLTRIGSLLAVSGDYNHDITRGSLLRAVDEDWNRPAVFNREESGIKGDNKKHPLYDRIRKTIIPAVTFRDTPLSNALTILADLSQIYDPNQRGFNILASETSQDGKNPPVTFKVTGLNLGQILDYIAKTTNYEWTVNDAGIIELASSSGRSDTELDVFTVTDNALKKIKPPEAMSSSAAQGGGLGGFAAAPAGGATIVGGGGNPDADQIKAYFQKLGIPFEPNSGFDLVFEGTTITVRHQRRYLDRIREILARLNENKMIHIATKFIEVNAGALKEAAVNWEFERTRASGQGGFAGVIRANAGSGLRTFRQAYGAEKTYSEAVISSAPVVDPVTGVSKSAPPTTIPIPLPMIPKSGYLGPENPTFDGIIGSVGAWDLRLIINAIESTEGSDLMANPSVVVKKGGTAKIEIVQRLPYPKSYSDADIQNNSGSYSNNNNNGNYGGSSIGYRSGTPQDMVWGDLENENRIGVVLEIPQVDILDGVLVDLELKPVIREFEGWVTYGGPSNIMESGTTATFPAAYNFPVFSERKVETKVTIYDGATVVLGGLTREEVRTVEEKVPVLGDIPLISRLFRSSAKSTSKRNLMIFVTANIITPGGGFERIVGRQSPSTLYHNPTVPTPGGFLRPTVRTPADAAPVAPTTEFGAAVPPAP